MANTEDLLSTLERVYHVLTDIETNAQERHHAEKQTLEILREHGIDPMSNKSLHAFACRKSRSTKTAQPAELCQVEINRTLSLSPLDPDMVTLVVGGQCTYDPTRPGIFRGGQWYGGPNLDYAFEGDDPALTQLP